MFLRRVVHVATETGPLDVVGGLAEGRHIGEVLVLVRQALEEFAVVQLGTGSRALEQHHAPCVALLQQVEDHRLRAGQPRAAGDEDQVAGLRAAHEELPVGAGQLDLVPHLQLVMDETGGRAALHQTHVQFHLVGAARRVGQGEGAGALDARQLQVDVLAGLESHGPVELQVHALDGRRQVDQAGDHGAVVLHRMAGEVRVDVDVGLDDHVALRDGAAGQHLALVALHVHQCERRGGTDVHLPFQHLQLAGGAGAVAAGEGQPDALAQCGLEDGLALLHFYLFAGGLDRDLVAHGDLLS
ncbi:hypothetical protein D9M69_436380 [compost metagenome]